MLLGLSAALTPLSNAAGEITRPSRRRPPQAACGDVRGKTISRRCLRPMTIKDFKVGQTAYMVEVATQG